MPRAGIGHHLVIRVGNSLRTALAKTVYKQNPISFFASLASGNATFAPNVRDITRSELQNELEGRCAGWYPVVILSGEHASFPTWSTGNAHIFDCNNLELGILPVFKGRGRRCSQTSSHTRQPQATKIYLGQRVNGAR